MNKNIYSQCVFDVDNRYVDIDIRELDGGGAFVLAVSDTSNDEESDTEIEIYLTKADLESIINRLTEVMKK
jgi:hypothetical protein